ncbi:MAG: carboxypeptidase regulatory-like domain-containing protein [Planctomycetes bacterium]|nr:carboxypeptidase regulatory-like domain-containing protein [Planctomycetota bacterium]
MRTLAVLVALAFAALFGYWLWSSDGGAEQWEVLEREAQADEAAPEVGELAAPVERIDGESAAAPHASSVVEEEREALVDEAVLTVRVLREGSEAPVRGKGVYLDFGEAREQRVEAFKSETPSTGRVGVGVLTNREGEARFRVPTGRELRAFVRLDDTAPPAGEVFAPEADTTLAVAALASGEERTVTLYAPREAREWHLRVVERETGLPVEGATVAMEDAWRKLAAIRSTHADATETIGEPPHFVLTDPDGRAVVRVEPDEHDTTTVHAGGYGPVCVPNETRREQEDDPFVVKLDRGATVRGKVLGLEDPAGAVASILVHCSLITQPPDEMFFRGSGEFRSCRLDEAGAFELIDLPPDVLLELKFALAEDEAVTVQADTLQLRAGEVYEHVWDLRKLGGVAGTVVDAVGAPMRGVDVWLVAGVDPKSFTPYAVPLQKERSDGDGRFVFRGLTEGDYLVGLGKQEQTDFAQRGAALAVAATVVQDAPTPDVELAVHRGVYLRGRVVLPSGEGAEAVHVFATRADGPSANTTTATGGEFELGPLLAGEHQLASFVLFHHEGVSAPPAVTVDAPASGIEIRLQVGGKIEGKIVDARTGEKVRGKTSIQRSFGMGRIATSVQGGHSSFDYDGLAAGTYHLVAESNDGRVGVLRDVRLDAGEILSDLEIPVGEASSLRCRYAGTRTSVQLRVMSGDVELASDTVRPGGLFECRAPLGTIVVEATSGDWSTQPEEREVYARRVVEVIADEELEVVLE